MGIAQALLGNPKILLLDEPTVGLDPEERNHFHSIIYKIKGKMSIILSTHLVEDVEDLCENIIILINGQIRKAGTTEQILQELQGRVFEIPEKQAQAFGDSVYIESHFKKENEPMARLVVLEENLNLAETYSPCAPDVQDAYLFHVFRKLLVLGRILYKCSFSPAHLPSADLLCGTQPESAALAEG